MSFRPKVPAYEIASRNFERAADLIDLSPNWRILIRTPFREMKVEVPLYREDGTFEVYEGFRIQHNGARGPFKKAKANTASGSPAPVNRSSRSYSNVMARTTESSAGSCHRSSIRRFKVS